jgi:serine/threonine-protein kinase
MNGAPRLLGGRYEIGELIGRGGMAEVHLGHDTRLGRSVAVKVLRADLARDTSFLARFRREAQSAAGLNHPAIVAVYDSGEEHTTESGGAGVAIPYIVMEYVEGRTLREVLDESGPFAPDEAARVTSGVLEALEYSHEKGIVHRDIKPANVMLTPTGAVKVMDFGIARALADTAATMTQTQAVIGTARYLSPEQAQGATVDARSDLYSTGCLFFELLTGRTPFIGEPVSLVYQHIGEMPQPPSTYESSVPPALDAVALHALAKDREERYQHAADFRADLAAARAGRVVSSAARATAAQAAALGAAGAAGVAGAGLAAAGAGGGLPTQAMDSAEAADAVGRAATSGAGGAADARPPRPPAHPDDTAEIPLHGDEPRHRGVYVVLALAALAVLGVIAYAGMTLMNNNKDDTPPQVSVPYVIGRTEAQAKSALTGAELHPVVKHKANSAAEGQVVDQNPKVNTMLDQGADVTIVVSTGPDSVTIPDLRGQSQSYAKSVLTGLGLKTKSEFTDDDPTMAKGKVVETDPGPGAVPAKSTVLLKVASGKVTVPSVVGKTEAEARNILAALRLKASVSYQIEQDINPDEVIRQDHEGKKVAVGTEVSLLVSQAPPTTATVTVTPPSSTTTSPPTQTSSTATTTSSSPTSSTATASRTTGKGNGGGGNGGGPPPVKPHVPQG